MLWLYDIPTFCVAQVIIPEQMKKGFVNLVESVDDLKLDVPGAADLVSLFVARAVVDDILAPSVVSKLASNGEEGSICEIQEKVQMHLSARHCTERLLRVWGAGRCITYSNMLKQWSVRTLKTKAVTVRFLHIKVT